MTRSRILGWLGTVFGSLGTLICLVILIALWVLSFQLRDSVRQVFDRASALLTRVHEGSTEMTAAVESSRQTVADLDQRIQDEIAALAERTEVEPRELEALAAEAGLIAGRLRDWVAFAGSTRDFVELAGGMIDSVSLFFQADEQDREVLLTAIESGRQQVAEAVTAFEDLVIQLENLRESAAEGEAYEKAIEPLFERIDGRLLKVREHCEAFSEGISRFDSATSRLGVRIRRGILIGTVLLSLLVLWMGAGQFCLARQGIARIRSHHSGLET